MPSSAEKSLRFSNFILDPSQASLVGPNGAMPLRPKAYDVLTYLVCHPGRIVSKDELMEAVWPNVFVTENSLVQCISDIRTALGDESQVLKTIARRGYMFAVPVSAVDPGKSENQSSVQVLSKAALLARLAEDQPGGPGAVRNTLPSRIAVKFGSPVFLVATGILITVGAIAAVWWEAGNSSKVAVSTPPASLAEKTSVPQRGISIAVLPFRTLDPSGDEYFADGLTEDIISALARFSDLTVLSPKTVAAYRGRKPTEDEINRNLKVRYIAEGSVRRTGGRVRISIHLADANHGNLLWAAQYDTDADQVLAIQDHITRQITGTLAIRLTNIEQARIAAKPPMDLEAYDLVLRGRDMLSRLTRTATSNARSILLPARSSITGLICTSISPAFHCLSGVK